MSRRPDARLLRALSDLVRAEGLEELTVECEGSLITIRGEQETVTVPVAPPPEVPQPAAPVVEPEAELAPGLVEVLAPMGGTFYAAPAPEEPPFVQEGMEVEVGQVLGLLEAMKVFNEIVSEHDGKVAKILARSEQQVVKGQPLFLLQTAERGT